jgi:two-component system response regulator YesN
MPARAKRSIQRAEPGEIWKARSFIRERLHEPLSLKQVAEIAGISPNYFSETFRKVTGQNFVRYINEQRLAQARDLLQSSTLRISEIAFAVGYQSLSQFNRMFKRVFSESPSNFRARDDTHMSRVT